MRTPPEDLRVDDLTRLLADAWRLPDADLRYLPVGFGSHHWLATAASGTRRFVTVDDLDGKGPHDEALTRLRRAMCTAHALRVEAGLSFVVAPQPSVDGSVVRPVGRRFAAAVYPFVDGQRYPDGEEATPQDRAAVVAVLARLHDATPTAQPHAGTDDLMLPGRGDLEQGLDRLGVPWTAGPFAAGTRDLLAGCAADLRALLRQYDRLAAAVRCGDVAWVVTHGEPKADNFLATGAGPVLVDWDTALVAPAARDLWLVEAGAGEELGLYAELTGRRVGPEDLAFFRLRWALADVADYVRWFSAPHARTPDAEIAWHSLEQTLRLGQGWPELL